MVHFFFCYPTFIDVAIVVVAAVAAAVAAVAIVVLVVAFCSRSIVT